MENAGGYDTSMNLRAVDFQITETFPTDHGPAHAASLDWPADRTEQVAGFKPEHLGRHLACASLYELHPDGKGGLKRVTCLIQHEDLARINTDMHRRNIHEHASEAQKERWLALAEALFQRKRALATRTVFENHLDRLTVDCWLVPLFDRDQVRKVILFHQMSSVSAKI